MDEEELYEYVCKVYDKEELSEKEMRELVLTFRKCLMDGYHSPNFALG